MTLFRVVYGRDPLLLLQLVEEESKVEVVNMVIKERNLILNELKANLSNAYDRMWRFVDKGRRGGNFEVRYYVFLKLQPY